MTVQARQIKGDPQVTTRDGAVVIRDATDTDAARWDAYVSAHPLGTPYHRYAWRQALREGYGLDTYYLLADQNTDQPDTLGVLPVARVPRPLGAGPLCALPYCDRGEPLAINTEVELKLLASLRSRAKGTLEVRGTGDPLDTPVSWEAANALPAGKKVRLLLDLPGSSEALLAGFKSKHRSQINKARRNGLEADTGNSEERVRRFYDVFTRNMRDLGSPTHSLRWFQAVSSAYGDDCSIGLVTLEGRTVAGGIVLRSGDRAAIPWASTLRDYNRLAPNMLLYWTLLAEAADSGISNFDFGRSSVGEGTYRFKTQWGARPVPLHWHTRNSARDASTDAGNRDPGAGKNHGGALRRLSERTWRRLPLPVTVALGARLRPMISL